MRGIIIRESAEYSSLWVFVSTIRLVVFQQEFPIKINKSISGFLQLQKLRIKHTWKKEMNYMDNLPNTDLIQGSVAWFAARIGKVTASRIADVVARTKTGWGASRANYMSALVCERLTGVQEETYTNAAMQWGTEKEPEARAAYEFLEGVKVEQVGFIDHPRIKMSGASPDGHIANDGSLEIKCPNTATHIEFLLEKSIPQKYMLQMQWQLACNGRAYCDFVSYDPRMPEGLRMFKQRVMRDSALIPTLEKDVSEFLAELDSMVAKLKGMM